MFMLQNTVRMMSYNARNKMKHFLRDENGDTNFVSIVIILVIVLVVASLFIAFKDDIMDTAKNIFSEFSNTFGKEDLVEDLPE